MQKKIAPAVAESSPVWETLESYARAQVRSVIQVLLEEEITELLGRAKSERRTAEEPVVYRNGYGKPRRLSMLSGTITVRRPRIRGLEERFESALLPFFKRRTEQVSALLPELYLHGLALGDFALALRGLLGEGAPLSEASLLRARAQWQAEYESWRQRSLEDLDVVYAWADGLYVKAGLVRSGDRRGAVEVYRFVRAHQAMYPIATMCRVLAVSTSGYYAWCKRPPSARAERDEELKQRIREIHERSDGTYGRPRMHAELRGEGEAVSPKRVGRLMREAGLQGVSRRRKVITTVRDAQSRPAPDLVDRQFKATGPDQLWVADITHIATWSGTLYLAVVLDVWSRRVVGWAMATHLRSELVVAALNMALEQRRPETVTHHSDHGSQYTSLTFGQRCREAGVRPSMGSVGDSYDNALCESFFATLECELLDRYSFRTPAHAEPAVFHYIEGWYNPHRRHSALGQLSPMNFEKLQRSAA